MKTMKKLASLTLALLLTIALAAPAFAAGEGTITIENAIEGVTYDAYRILDLEAYDSAKGAYLYTVNTAWADFFAADGAAYIAHEVDGVANEYVTIKKATETQTDAEWAAALAADAFTWLDAHIITTSGTVTATKGEGDDAAVTAVITGLDLGYYLVNSSLGSVCSLNTADPDATIQEKNEVPSLEKTVNVTDNLKIGDPVEFTVTIHAKPGAANYVLTDTMGAGLTRTDSVTIKMGDTALASPDDYTVEGTDSFEVTFTEKTMNAITAATDIVVTYNAFINENANETSVTNTAFLTFGDNHQTPDAKVEIPFYSFDLVKTNSSNAVLQNANFSLYASEVVEGERVIDRDTVINLTAGKVDPNGAANFDAGKVAISGLSAGTYFLVENSAPQGYNKVADPIKVDLTAEMVKSATMDENDANLYVTGGVQVINLTGAELPSTGGIGTTIFYVVGGLLAVGAGVLLITRKRAGEEE